MNLPLGIDEFERRVGYTFRNKTLIETALTHSSYSNELKVRKVECECNERLEFLGDSVLSIIVSEYLFEHYSDRHAEGDLTRMRADVVCERALAGYSQKIGLGQFLRLGRGEDKNNGRERKSILADAFEATLAAVFLDSGAQSDGSARELLLRLLSDELRNCKRNRGGDYKTKLQQFIQQNGADILKYELVSEDGPDHDKHFVVRAMLNSNEIGRGEGRSKKEAEQQAACQALSLFGEPLR